jgi:nucleotide-binding universal stress UspA family protein
MFREIVVPLDGSPFGEFALPFALAIGERGGGSIRLLTIVTPLPADQAGEDRAAEEAGRLLMAREHAEKYHANLLGRVASAGWDLPVAEHVETGSVVEELDRHARLSGADLLVMTTHGRGPLRRAWLGSVADGLLRRTPCPILAIRPEEAGVPALDPVELRHILVPLDGSRESLEILPYAKGLAAAFGARITLFRVVPPHFPLTSPFTSHGGHGFQGWAGEKEVVRQGLEEAGERLRQEDGLEVTVEVLLGTHPADGILSLADTARADLVAMTTHGRGGVARMILGSVADKVVRGGSTPVLLHRAAQAS